MVSHKEITEQDLIKQHRKLMETHMKVQRQWGIRIRKVILETYDNVITKENIRFYLNRDIKIFTTCLALGQIKRAAKYFPKGYLQS